MKIKLAKEELCCGCGTCELVCPVQAIRMEPKELGCLYPKIDDEKCIGCHACEKVCAFLTDERADSDAQIVYAAATKDKQLLKRSASGGIFAAVAHSVIDAGGIVYGCSLEMKEGCLSPMHIGVTEHDAVKKLQGSKYVQSTLGNTFAEIRCHLQSERIVLFSGTPCQVDALKHYLRDMDTSGLFTMDLVCHGVPSGKLFRDYLETLKRKEKATISGFSFRDKTDGWGLNAGYTVTSHGTEESRYRKLSPGISSYYTYFLKSEIYRENCYSCRYAGPNRVGDVTIGDFWGIEKEHPELLTENGGKLCMRDGISTVIVNNAQGLKLLARFGKDLEIHVSEIEKASKWNRQLRAPSTHSELREDLVKIYEKDGYPGIERVFRKELGIRYPVRLIKHWIWQKHRQDKT